MSGARHGGKGGPLAQACRQGARAAALPCRPRGRKQGMNAGLGGWSCAACLIALPASQQPLHGSTALHCAGPKAASHGTVGPAATWVAVQHPAKRRRAEPGAAPAAAAGSGDENDSEEEVGPASPAKAGAARLHAALLAHNAAVKADARAMQGRRAAFLDEHLQVRQWGLQAHW